jgi:hypothetical protein
MGLAQACPAPAAAVTVGHGPSHGHPQCPGRRPLWAWAQGRGRRRAVALEAGATALTDSNGVRMVMAPSLKPATQSVATTAGFDPADGGPEGRAPENMPSWRRGLFFVQEVNIQKHALVFIGCVSFFPVISF